MKVNSAELTARLPQLAFFGINHSYCGLEMRNRPQEDLLVQRPMLNGRDSDCLPSNMAFEIGDTSCRQPWLHGSAPGKHIQ